MPSCLFLAALWPPDGRDGLLVLLCVVFSCVFVASRVGSGRPDGRGGLLALLFVVFSCVFVAFPCGVPGPVWCLVVSIPDLCLLLCFK